MQRYIKEKHLLPLHYVKVDEPFFSGRGNHSVNQLEDICEQYKELVHQLRLREQALLSEFNITIVNKMPNCVSIGRAHIIEDDNTKCSDCGHDFSEAK